MAFTNLRAAIRNWTTNQSVTSAGLRRTGLLPTVLLLDGIVSWLFGTRTEPRSGWVGDAGFATVSTLTVTVSPGLGFAYDSSASVGVWDPPAYKPICIPANTTVVLDAHAGSARIDLVYATVALTDDQPDTVRIRSAGPGSQASATRNLRSAWIVTVAKVSGTPGSGTPPATPSGGIPIALAHVPATSGTVRMQDVRQVLHTRYHMPFIPDSGIPDDASENAPYTQNVVQKGMVPTGLSGLSYRLTEGYVDSFGERHKVPETPTVTHATADPTNPRIDLVYLFNGTEVNIETGTPAAVPVAPTLADAISSVGWSEPRTLTPLWLVTVNAADTTLSYPSDFTDIRPLAPITAAQIARKPLFIKATVAAEVSNVRAVTLQLIDQDGADVSGVKWSALIRGYDVTGAVAPVADACMDRNSFNDIIYPSPSAGTVSIGYCASDSNGEITFDVSVAAGTQLRLIEILPSFLFQTDPTAEKRSEAAGARTIFSAHPMLLEVDFA